MKAMSLGIEDKSKLEDLEKEMKNLSDYLNILDKEMKKYTRSINDTQERISKNQMLIKINFSDNIENNKIVKIVDEITDKIRNYNVKNGWSQFKNENEQKELVATVKNLRNEISDKIDNLVDIVRNYYKNEWEKVKLGK